MADDATDTAELPAGGKNVLAVIGSPHRGATVRAVERIEARLRAAGDIEVNYLYLRDAGLEGCRGYFRCLADGEAFCPVHDSRDDLLARLDACNGAIFASPTYVQNVSGLYKTFVDRFAWICHRPRFYPKPAIAVASTEKAAAALDGAAERLASALRTDAPFRPERWRVLHFRSMRAVTLERPGACPADTAFYLPLADSDFFVPAHLSPIDRLSGAIVDRAARRHARREYRPKP